eukprot:CAMPEP_0119035474 /NCGR_PEP_ID=MMETSP1177-20130426/2514_1 /TAXON_ID=2985 /ORGANISM="Ochromonas sp, Strain CCMP1899" /LENGTH=46 /DNA_ID= /DNA_START= /DNA_END= /DNA_ORIENTATION=
MAGKGGLKDGHKRGKSEESVAGKTQGIPVGKTDQKIPLWATKLGKI